MKKVILKRLLPYLYPYKKHIFVVLSLSLINVILSLINPILIGKLFCFIKTKRFLRFFI